MLDETRRLKLIEKTLGNTNECGAYTQMVREALAYAKSYTVAPEVTDSVWNRMSHDKKLEHLQRLDEELKDDIEDKGFALRKMASMDDTILIKTKEHELYVSLDGDNLILREKEEL